MQPLLCVLREDILWNTPSQCMRSQGQRRTSVRLGTHCLGEILMPIYSGLESVPPESMSMETSGLYLEIECLL